MNGRFPLELFFVLRLLVIVCDASSCSAKVLLSEIFNVGINQICPSTDNPHDNCRHEDGSSSLCAPNLSGIACEDEPESHVIEAPCIDAVATTEGSCQDVNINDIQSSSNHSSQDIHKDSKEISLNDVVNSTNAEEKASNASTGNSKQAVCNETETLQEVGDVELVNATSIQQILQSDPNITTRSLPAQCFLVYFFSHHCFFSVQGSGYVNALARSVRNIPVYGLDSIEHHSMNARYGVMGTPSLVLFHNGNVAGRFNASEYSTSALLSFINHFTNQKIDFINVTSHDFTEIQLPCEVKPGFPMTLYASWLFLVILVGYVFFTSELYAKLSETFLNNWREAEAQHTHQD